MLIKYALSQTSILETIIYTYGVKDYEVNFKKLGKRLQKGGFLKRIFLESVEDLKDEEV